MKLSYNTLEEMLAEAKNEFGATHYSLTRSGGVEMFYKHDPVKNTFQYLSYCDLWQGSSINLRSEEVKSSFLQKLIAI